MDRTTAGPIEFDQAARDEMYRTIYVQNAEWFRHVENERLAFTQIFSAITAAVLLLANEPTVAGSRVPLYAFLVVLAALGFLMSLRFRADLDDFADRLRRMIPDGMDDLVGLGAPRWPQWLRLRELFPAFYTLAGGLHVFLLVEAL